MYYNIINKSNNKAVNVSGSYLLDLTTRTNVTLYSQTGSNEQVWRIDALTGTVKVRSYVNDAYGFNIARTTSNCDVIPISGNDADSNIQFELQSDGYYKIKSVSTGKYLTPVGSSDGANIQWSASSTSDLQKWSFVEVDLAQLDRERTEYYIESGFGNTGWLGAGGYDRLAEDTSLQVFGPLRENKIKWFFKGKNPNMKIYSKHGDNYLLSLGTQIMGRSMDAASYTALVKQNPTEEESSITMIPYSSLGTTMYEIKHTATGLYLTHISNTFIVWSAYRSVDHDIHQVWHIYNYPHSEVNGVDTSSQCNSTTRNALVLGKESFVGRYYAPFTYAGKRFFPGNNTEAANCTIAEIEAIDIDNIELSDVVLHSKNLTLNEVNLFKEKDIEIVSIYQNHGKIDTTHPNEFSELAAHIAAFSALTCAKLFGQPTASAIYFAVDYDAPSSMDDTLKTYFDIIKTKLATRGYRTGVYGGGAVCSMLKAAGKVDFTWLAGASGWRGSSNYLNYNIKQGELYEYNGVDFDENVAMGGVSNQCDYGQWIFPKG